MIRLSTSRGIEFVAAENIARITEAGVSLQWHGIRAIVRLFDGGVIEARESAQDIARLLAAAPEAPTPPAPQPLTEDEIERLIQTYSGYCQDDFVSVARAVEAEVLKRVGVGN